MAQRRRKALGQHHLDDVAGGDVLLGLAHHVLEALLGEVGVQGRPRRRRQRLGRGTGWRKRSMRTFDGRHRPVVLGL